MKKTHKLTDEQKIQIVEKYNSGKYICKILALEYNVSISSIFSLLKRRNVKLKTQSELQRKYSLNEHYFDKVDTKEKAYFLGLLYADGCNKENKNNIQITLAETDKYILEKFKYELSCNSPLRIEHSNNKNPNRQNTFRLSISSKHMSQQLAKLGCFQRKSLTLKFPTEEQVPKHLLNHFIRGMWDGDGSITISKNQPYCKLTSTSYFCDSLKEILNNINITSGVHRMKRSIKNNNTTRDLNIGRNRSNISKFLNWLYQDATIYLKRKHQKYQECLSLFNDI